MEVLQFPDTFSYLTQGPENEPGLTANSIGFRNPVNQQATIAVFLEARQPYNDFDARGVLAGYTDAMIIIYNKALEPGCEWFPMASGTSDYEAYTKLKDKVNAVRLMPKHYRDSVYYIGRTLASWVQIGGLNALREDFRIPTLAEVEACYDHPSLKPKIEGLIGFGHPLN